MTDKEKLIKIKSLADKMSDTAFNLTTDASLLRKAMDDYHQFVINEYHKEEPISEELEIAANEWNAKASFTPFYMALDDNGNPNGVRQDYTTHAESFKAGAEWLKAKLMKDAIDVTVHIEAGNYPYIPQMELYDYDRDVPLAKEGDRYKVILIKEE